MYITYQPPTIIDLKFPDFRQTKQFSRITRLSPHLRTTSAYMMEKFVIHTRIWLRAIKIFHCFEYQGL